jgi:TolB protein
VAVVAALLSAGCSAPTPGQGASSSPETSASPSTPTGARTLALGAEGPAESIPWEQVGPGWKLATWSPAASRLYGLPPDPGAPAQGTVPSTLYLVNPAGGRYAITTFPPPGANSFGPALIDWSGDGGRALFSDGGDGAPATTVIEVDLHSGAHTKIPLVDANHVRYTRPEGKALLLTKYKMNEPSVLERVDLAGKPQLTYPLGLPAVRGTYLSTPDGTRLVLAAEGGLVLMGNDGKASTPLPVADQIDCSPLRWWDGGAGKTVLATCFGGGDSSGSRLLKVPIDGSAPTPLTAPNNGQKDPDLGDLNAWQLPAGTFVQAHGGCGFVFLAKLNADGTTTRVAVPDLDPHHSVVVVGVNEGNLDLVGNVAGCGPAESLVEYDPTAGTTTVLLGPPLNGGAIIDALPFPGQD